MDTFEHPPKTFLRYVDDCFCVIHNSEVQSFLHHLNSIERSIEFTVDEESNGRIAFLDVLVQRSSGGCSTTVHRKPTHSGKYLSFASAHPLGHKRSVAASLFKRALRLCSDDSARRREYAKVKHDLTGNGYPRQLLRQQELRSREPPGNKPSDRKKTAPILMLPA